LVNDTSRWTRWSKFIVLLGKKKTTRRSDRTSLDVWTVCLRAPTGDALRELKAWQCFSQLMGPGPTPYRNSAEPAQVGQPDTIDRARSRSPHFLPARPAAPPSRPYRISRSLPSAPPPPRSPHLSPPSTDAALGSLPAPVPSSGGRQGLSDRPAAAPPRHRRVVDPLRPPIQRALGDRRPASKVIIIIPFPHFPSHFLGNLAPLQVERERAVGVEIYMFCSSSRLLLSTIDARFALTKKMCNLQALLCVLQCHLRGGYPADAFAQSCAAQ
jgi:hypothetical protein